MTENNIVVSHNTGQGCFETTVQGYRAFLEYRLLDHNRIDMFHTFVPDELRGKGVAGELARAALSYANQNGLLVEPTCSYVKAYLERQGKQAVC